MLSVVLCLLLPSLLVLSEDVDVLIFLASTSIPAILEVPIDIKKIASIKMKKSLLPDNIIAAVALPSTMTVVVL